MRGQQTKGSQQRDPGTVSFHQSPRVVVDVVFTEVDPVPNGEELSTAEIEFSLSSERDPLRFSLDEAVDTLHDVGIDPDDYLRSEVVEDYTLGYRIGTRRWKYKIMIEKLINLSTK
jgi:hypothetical protein